MPPWRARGGTSVWVKVDHPAVALIVRHSGHAVDVKLEAGEGRIVADCGRHGGNMGCAERSAYPVC